MDREFQEELLAHGSISIEGRIVASSNQALLVVLESAGVSARACYKAEAGERPLWDFPEGLWRREVAAYELDRLAGTDLVPTTVARDDAPFGPGSLQWWIEDAFDEHYFTLRDRPEFVSWFARLAAFDVVANNADRKAGHILLDAQRLWAIDNGLCFHGDDKLRTVIWDFAGEPLGDEVTAHLERLLEGDASRLAAMLVGDELEYVLMRAQRLLAAGHFPEPDPDGDYPPYPWPLI
ncbi:MAG: phosphatidylinositol kinase [Acidobacteriota bacterium]|nr:phosphatidylinositol kinase [Acidobacteriota bacterium]